MKKAILILLTVLLAVSCSQVVYDNLPPVEIGGKYDTTLIATQDGNSTALKLRFNAVPYIAQYGYDVNGSDIEEIPDSEIKVVGGADYEFTISSEDIGNQYNGEIYLYGKVPSDVGTEEWVNIGYTEYSIAIEGTAPVVNLYARNETEAVLYLDSPPAGMMYKVDVKEDSNGEPIEGLSVSDLLPEKDGMLHILNLDRNQSYIFDVYQKKAGEEDAYPTVYTSVEVGPFTNEVKLVLTEEENTGFVVEIAEDLTGITTVTLVNNTTDEEIATVDVTGNSATFAYYQIPSLESGLFYAKTKTTSAGEEYISNYIDTITPITVLEMTPNYRSVDIKVKFSDQITDPAKDIALSTPGTSSSIAFAKEDDDSYLLMINDLISNTPYPNLNLRATVNNNRITITLDSFRTKSFAGITFEWNGTLIPGTLDEYGGPKKTNFVISVENSVEGSNFPYYVYFNDSDDFIKTNDLVGNKIRIMPLADSSVTNDIEVSKINDAYKYNSKKWNSSGITPPSWKISSTEVSNDSVLTITSSDSGIGFIGMVDTATTFEFNETRNENNVAIPYVKFKNTGYGKWGGTVTLGLYSNEAYKTEYIDFESSLDPDAKYCWYLVPVNLTEGDAE